MEAVASDNTNARPFPPAPSMLDSAAPHGLGSRAKGRNMELQEEAAEDRSSKEHSESPSLAMTKLTFGLRKASSSGASGLPVAKKPKLEGVFNTEADDAEEKPKKRLVPIDYSDEDREGSGARASLADKLGLRGGGRISPDERKKRAQMLVNSIPTDKEEVFDYQLKWEAIDKVGAGGGGSGCDLLQPPLSCDRIWENRPLCASLIKIL